jgi:hypothetical protein
MKAVAIALASSATIALASFACGGSDSISAEPADAGPDAAPVLETEAGAPCGPTDDTQHFRCSADGNARRKCEANVLASEGCARGCLKAGPDGGASDDTCMGTDTTWSCPGSFGTQKAQNGDYYITAFGCWIDADGGAHGDPGDNCVPGCFDKAKAAGVCNAGETGKQCEERITWFTADAARFGCLAKIRITNPANGKSVVAIALDSGPGCSVESKVSKAVLDTSGRIDRELFGVDHGVVDKALVHVVEVDPSTPLGPTP